MKVNYRFLPGALLALCAMIFLCSTEVHAQSKGKGGNGGGGGSETPPPALVYVVNDAVITVASADGQTISKLTGGSRGWSISTTPVGSTSEL